MSATSNLTSSILNGQTAFLKSVCLPVSKKSIALLFVLVQEGFIRGFFVNNKNKLVYVLLKYHNNIGVIKSFVFISHVNKVIFFKVKMLWQFQNGLGTWIVSTSKGILTSQTAIKKHVGGCMLMKIC